MLTKLSGALRQNWLLAAASSDERSDWIQAINVSPAATTETSQRPSLTWP